jgi:glutamate synthase domain-containing protein 1
MCGVIGLLVKDPALEPALGSMLVPMIEALGDRGPDSSGVAVYADGDPFGAVPGPGGPGASLTPVFSGDVTRVSLGSDRDLDWAELRADLESSLGATLDVRIFETGAVIRSSDAGTLLDTVASRWPDVRLLGLGRALSVVKDTGRPEATCRRYGIGSWQGYLAVAHTRMATESEVTVLHSHPFVPAPDLCVVHNGSFSNYASVRRPMVAEGVVFDSDNDSEVAARFLAGRLELGDDLEEATRWVMKEMDGFFTLVIATDGAMSVVRDAFACKPAVVAETAGYVAVASEYRALAELPGIASATVFEPQPEEVYTWTR